MTQTETSRPPRRPVLLIAAGRQRVGKTTFLNAVTQHLREHGSRAAIWNGDQMNVTNNLATFHDDVDQPASSDGNVVRDWLESRIGDIVERRYDAILDVGGGETEFSRLLREVNISEVLRAEGVRVVLASVMGPDQADVDYLASYLEHRLFSPEDVLMVLNSGLVVSGASVATAFAGVSRHPVVASALLGGAQSVFFPALTCMAAVTDRGLQFQQALSGMVRPGTTPLSFLDRQRVAIWWRKAVPGFFAEIDPLLLPATGSEAAAFACRPDAVPAPAPYAAE